MVKEKLIHHFKRVREQTEALCQPLATEDYVIQSMEDVSPPKWHLAHSSWFFETFILSKQLTRYQLFHPAFHHLFNSYYQGIGHPYPRAKRGLLSRPTVEIVYAYRNYIDTHLLALIEQTQESQFSDLSELITLGLHHEQQHQELLLTDIKYNFSLDPTFPAYQTDPSLPEQLGGENIKPQFIEVDGTIASIGHDSSEFSFDNERPSHKKILIPYAIATQLVTNGEYLQFIEDGGYNDPKWWLADGWDYVMNHHWKAPLYWHRWHNEWHLFTLNGLKPLNLNEPVCHVSYYEADAFAKWQKARLPSEEEWEHFVSLNEIQIEKTTNFMEMGLFHPRKAVKQTTRQWQQFFGDLWEWTSSAYSPYPGYRPLKGALGEYNGKFMANQMVLRGGSCGTPRSHIRRTYRNFFQPEKRWQFSGFRLAFTL